MHPRDCPAWEYESIGGYQQILLDRSAELLLNFRTDRDQCATAAIESRPTHARLYLDLTPAKCPYFAGHFRGEEFRCLKHYTVGTLDGDPAVGYAPIDVQDAMRDLEKAIRQGLNSLDQFVASGRSRVAGLIQIVRVAARIFELFLRIHPYANGNGHAARIFVCALLGRYGFWPSTWAIEPRTKDPRYIQSIKAYRTGRTEDLERFILECAKWG